MTWDLASLRSSIATDGSALLASVQALDPSDPAGLYGAVLAVSDHRSLCQAEAFADTADAGAGRRMAFAEGPLAAALEQALDAVDPAVEPTDAAARRYLSARRMRRIRRLDPAAESVANVLGEHGLRAWSGRWQRIQQDVMRALAEVPAPNSLADHRRRAEAWIAAWRARREDVAEVATHVSGHRGSVAALLGVDPLAPTLADNAMSAATVESVVAACRAARPALWRYLRARARLLGADPAAPCPPGSRHHPLVGAGVAVPIEEAFDRVVGAFAPFSPRLAAFARRAQAGSWVDHALRPAKRRLATCWHFAAARQSRILYPHDGLPGSVVTLAHELGHAWHAEVLFGRGPSAVDVPVSLAEGASLVAEGLARPVAAGSDALGVLDGFLSGAAKWMLDGCRTFLLERAVSELRREGPLHPDALDEVTARLQQEWFAPEELVDPTYWASQGMLYLPDRAYFAIPYAVAFVFASRVLAEADSRGPAFADAWERLLLACEDGTVEDVAREHLGLDPTRPGAFDPVQHDLEHKVAAFEALATA